MTSRSCPIGYSFAFEEERAARLMFVVAEEPQIVAHEVVVDGHDEEPLVEREVALLSRLQGLEGFVPNVMRFGTSLPSRAMPNC
ncbi:MAG: hypothetical protein U0271_11120 [Polyangiaceae bacterium]